MAQEFYRDDPWKVLVVCLMIVRGVGKRAKPVADEFFGKWPTPESLEGVSIAEIERIVKPLGMSHVRAIYIKMMTQQYSVIPEDKRLGIDPRIFSGCGQYVKDAWDIFVLNKRLNEDNVNDVKLKAYLREGMSDSEKTTNAI